MRNKHCGTRNPTSHVTTFEGNGSRRGWQAHFFARDNRKFNKFRSACDVKKKVWKLWIFPFSVFVYYYVAESLIAEGIEPSVSVILTAKSITDSLALLHKIPVKQMGYVGSIYLHGNKQEEYNVSLETFRTMGFHNIRSYVIESQASLNSESYLPIDKQFENAKFLLYLENIEDGHLYVDLQFAVQICAEPKVFAVSFLPLRESLYSQSAPTLTAGTFYWHEEPQFTSIFVCRWRDFRDKLTVEEEPIPFPLPKGQVQSWKKHLLSFSLKHDLRTLYPRTSEIFAFARAPVHTQHPNGFSKKVTPESPGEIFWWTNSSIPIYNLFSQKITKQRVKPLVSLVTTLPPYDVYDLPRREELIRTVRTNLANSFFDKVYIFEEGGKSVSYYHYFQPYIDIRKVKWRFIDNQLSYQQLLEFINSRLTGELVILAHSDIYFDWTISCSRALEDNTTLIALSRQPTPLCPEGSLGGRSQTGERVPLNFCLDYLGSHDAFIFKSPLNVDLGFLKIMPNSFGAENMLIYSAKFANYTVLNPCMDIVALHLHCDSSVRQSHDHTHHINERLQWAYPYDLYAYPVRFSFCRNYYFYK